MREKLDQQTSSKAELEAHHGHHVVVREIGTSTYSRIDYAKRMISGQPEECQIYHCYHMCRDAADRINNLEIESVQAWNVMGMYETESGFKQLHPILIVQNEQGKFLYDPAYGIIDGVRLDNQTCCTENGNFTITQDGDDITLVNNKNKKSFSYIWTPRQSSFATNDHLLVRRNNFGNDAYSMTYRYDETGKVKANVTLFHQDQLNPNEGFVMVCLQRPDGSVGSIKFSKNEVTCGKKNYCSELQIACSLLEVDFDSLNDDLKFMLLNIGELREAQKKELRKESERQKSGIPLF